MASNVAPYEFLWIVQESALGTPMVSPVAGTNSIYIRLAGANRFTMRTKPNFRKIPFGGGFAVQGYTVTDQTKVTGNLQVELCYTQAQLLLDWAVTRINSGQTTPWTTTEDPGDLASCTVYHGVKRSDGTIIRRQYSGVKVSSWSLPSAADSGLSLLNLGLIAKRVAASDPDATAFPAPADTLFPTDPVLFIHSTANFTVGGSALAYCQEGTLSAENMLDARYFQSAYLSLCKLRGRKAKADFGVLLTASPNWYGLFEAATVQALICLWTNTTHTITLQFNGNNLLASLDDSLEPGKLYDQKFELENQYSTSASEDIHFTFA